MLSSNSKLAPLIPICFEDIDRFSAWTHSLGWDLDSVQLDAGSNAVYYDHFLLPGLMLIHYRAGRKTLDTFALPKNTMLFLIQRSECPLVYCGREISPSMMGIACCGEERWTCIPTGLDCYELMVDEDVMKHLELMPESFIQEVRQVEKAYLPLVQPLAGYFLEQLDLLFRMARSSEIIALPETGLRDLVLELLHLLIDNGLKARGKQGTNGCRRPELVENSREYIYAHIDEDFSISQMADALDVSYRSLHYAFQDALGATPLQFKRAVKLREVKRLLSNSDSSVTDAAMKYGFTHLGRFASQYASHFGELTSVRRR